jgi:hypothetical protein
MKIDSKPVSQQKKISTKRYCHPSSPSGEVSEAEEVRLLEAQPLANVVHAVPEHPILSILKLKTGVSEPDPH